MRYAALKRPFFTLLIRLTLLITLSTMLLVSPLADNASAATPTNTPIPTTAAVPPITSLPWLKTIGNQIVTEDGQPVTLRGANTGRSDWVLSMEWERKAIPELAQTWGGNVLVRGIASNPINNPNYVYTAWHGTVNQATYLQWLDEYVQLTEQNNMYLIFAWRSQDINGNAPMPDDGAQQALVTLAKRYHGKAHVLYALQAEPHNVTWSTLLPRFNSMVTAIREASAPYKPLIFVPGTQWSRDVHWAITQPVTADQGINIVYKSHPYNPSADFQRLFLDTFNAGLPVFLGEFGPYSTWMTMADVEALLQITRERNIGWAAWLLDWEGPVVLLADANFTPSEPYGRVVQRDMRTSIIPTALLTHYSYLPVVLRSFNRGW